MYCSLSVFQKCPFTWSNFETRYSRRSFLLWSDRFMPYVKAIIISTKRQPKFTPPFRNEMRLRITLAYSPFYWGIHLKLPLFLASEEPKIQIWTSVKNGRWLFGGKWFWLQSWQWRHGAAQRSGRGRVSKLAGRRPPGSGRKCATVLWRPRSAAPPPPPLLPPQHHAASAAPLHKNHLSTLPSPHKAIQNSPPSPFTATPIAPNCNPSPHSRTSLSTFSTSSYNQKNLLSGMTYPKLLTFKGLIVSTSG